MNVIHGTSRHGLGVTDPRVRRDQPRGKALIVLLAGLALVVAIAGLAGSRTSRTGRPAVQPATGSTPAGDQAVQTVRQGEAVSVTSRSAGGSDVMLYQISADRQYERSPVGGFRSFGGGVFYAVAVSVTCISGSAVVTPGDFALIGSDGRIYPATAGPGWDNALERSVLQPGEKATGLVIYQLPKAAVAGARIRVQKNGYYPLNQEVNWLL